MVIKRDAEKGCSYDLMEWAACGQHYAYGVTAVVSSWAEDAPRGPGGAPCPRQGFVGKCQDSWASSDVTFPFLAVLLVIINQGHSSVLGLSEVIAISTGWALAKLMNSSFSACPTALSGPQGFLTPLWHGTQP